MQQCVAPSVFVSIECSVTSRSKSSMKAKTIQPNFYVFHPVVLDIITREINAVNPTSKFAKVKRVLPIPVAARSKARVYGRSLAGIVGSNPA